MAKVILKSTRNSLSSSNSGGLSPYEPRASEVNGIVPLNEDNITHIEQGIQKIIQETNLALEETASKEYVDELVATPIPSPAQHANKFLKVKTDGSGLEYGEGGGGSSYVPMIEITWAELKALRDNEELVPGQQYRITDYVTSTIQKDTKSADHPFDIIVTADNKNTLNENARAIQHKHATITKLVPTEVQNITTENPVHIEFTQTIDDEEIEYARGEGPGRLDIDEIVYTAIENNLPIFYKTDIEVYPDEPDTFDKHVWNDRYELDGVTYDRWVKYEDGAKTNRYVLTQIITSNLQEVEIELEDYFDNSNLGAWEIKYSLESNNRYSWAIDENISIITLENNGTYKRTPQYDENGHAAWCYCDEGITGYADPEDRAYTDMETTVGGTLYQGTNTEVGETYDDTILAVDNYLACKGVVYYMKDEWKNEAPYDFKNIQFKRYMINTNPGGNLNFLAETYAGVLGCIYDNGDAYPDENNYKWMFTFNDHNTDKDLSLDAYGGCCNNTIKANIEGRIWALNNNVISNDSILNCCLEKDSYNNTILDFSHNTVVNGYANILKQSFNTFIDTKSSFNVIASHSCRIGKESNNNIIDEASYKNIIGDSCYHNKFIGSSAKNIIGTSCKENIFINASYNSLGLECDSNTISGGNCNSLGNYCYQNVIDSDSNGFGNRCYNNILKSGSKGNLFGNQCYYNTLGVDAQYNVFDNYCNNNNIGDNCKNNRFGSNSYSNTLGLDCSYNTFGSRNSWIQLANTCKNNSFGNSSSQISFGVACNNNTVGNECILIWLVPLTDTYPSAAINNCFEDGVSNVSLVADSVATTDLQNITLKRGVKGTYTDVLTIRESRNKAYDTIYRAEGAEDKVITI